MTTDSAQYEIYTISGAPRPWRVTLGFVAKGIDFTLRVLESSKKEHKSPSFLALNPRGRVPVLRSGDFILTESLAILSYLERAHPEPALFGTSPQEHARIWRLVSEGVHDLNDSSAALLRPIFSGEDEKSEGVKKGAASLRPELKRLEELVGESRFLDSDRVTAADCVCFPPVRLLLRASERYPDTMRRLELDLAAAYPRLAAWVERVEALPGYEKTFPSHWRAAPLARP
jgi:glutathione S-transferase